jgi:hypothetical protein
LSVIRRGWCPSRFQKTFRKSKGDPFRRKRSSPPVVECAGSIGAGRPSQGETTTKEAPLPPVESVFRGNSIRPSKASCADRIVAKSSIFTRIIIPIYTRQSGAATVLKLKIYLSACRGHRIDPHEDSRPFDSAYRRRPVCGDSATASAQNFALSSRRHPRRRYRRHPDRPNHAACGSDRPKAFGRRRWRRATRHASRVRSPGRPISR